MHLALSLSLYLSLYLCFSLSLYVYTYIYIYIYAYIYVRRRYERIGRSMETGSRSTADRSGSAREVSDGGRAW